MCLALIILSLTFWFILQNLEINKFIKKINNKFLIIFLIIIFIQIILGAFLAGLNGGLLYNSWPDMNGNFLPNDIIKTDLYLFKSLNNPSVIQFYHRLMAYILLIFLFVLNYFFYIHKIKTKAIILLNLTILFQMILGILTLITGVKIYYASLHQLGSVFVLTSFLLIFFKNSNL